MAHKEFVKLFEQNILLFDKLSDKLKRNPSVLSGFPRQQLSILVRLHIGGPALLKDIARREMVTAPNLCAAFRKLERDGLVLRKIDDNDRRNTWYSVTKTGEKIATQAIENMRNTIEKLFGILSRADEEALTKCGRRNYYLFTRHLAGFCLHAAPFASVTLRVASRSGTVHAKECHTKF